MVNSEQHTELPPLPETADQAVAVRKYLGAVASGQGGTAPNLLQQWIGKAWQAVAAGGSGTAK